MTIVLLTLYISSYLSLNANTQVKFKWVKPLRKGGTNDVERGYLVKMYNVTTEQHKTHALQHFR